jgi:hypothetical protein
MAKKIYDYRLTSPKFCQSHPDNRLINAQKSTVSTSQAKATEKHTEGACRIMPMACPPKLRPVVSMLISHTWTVYANCRTVGGLRVSSHWPLLHETLLMEPAAEGGCSLMNDLHPLGLMFICQSIHIRDGIPIPFIQPRPRNRLKPW